MDTPDLAHGIQMHMKSALHSDSALAALEAGDPRLALHEFTSAFNVFPNPDAAFNAGNCAAQIADWNLARSWWQKSLDMNPNQPDVHVNLANLYALRPPRSLALALSHLRAALRLSPDDPEIMFNLAAVLEAKAGAGAGGRDGGGGDGQSEQGKEGEGQREGDPEQAMREMEEAERWYAEAEGRGVEKGRGIERGQRAENTRGPDPSGMAAVGRGAGSGWGWRRRWWCRAGVTRDSPDTMCTPTPATPSHTPHPTRTESHANLRNLRAKLDAKRMERDARGRESGGSGSG
ncbi:hypothetical protein HDU93_001326 [Gonapodya sp. JEL0774]|nr:hypothetical protein HDU93_001326 [Gonapodya sp. JEL0774]